MTAETALQAVNIGGGTSAERSAAAEYPARSIVTQLKSLRLSSGQRTFLTASAECALR